MITVRAMLKGGPLGGVWQKFTFEEDAYPPDELRMQEDPELNGSGRYIKYRRIGEAVESELFTGVYDASYEFVEYVESTVRYMEQNREET